jgi:DNA helicase-2/ATP-dependent DNA helicase PcrA
MEVERMTPLDEGVAQRLDGIGSRDHTSTAEYRIFGPPGTGKTTNLTRQIGHAVDRFGENSVLVTSFSRAAAAELTSRDLPINLDRIGTLHAHAFRVLGKPSIAEVHAAEWNRENPRLTITPVSRQLRIDGEDTLEEEQEKDGDRLLQQLNRSRAMMLPAESWSPEVRAFFARWSRFKTANGLLDFTDLIETALRDVKVAPGNPAVIVADEAQDLNRLEMTLLRSWAGSTNHWLLAGDDDQAIYSYTGVTPDVMLDPDIPEDHKVFLKQSARVPRAVHTLAERFIRQVSRRQEKAYLPRPEDGNVHRLSQGGYRSPEYGILKTAERHLGQGKSVMFLASCSYMLRPIIAVLRKNGIPFHNPHRKSAGFWNPLRLGSSRSAANRSLALLVAHLDFGVDRHAWRNRDLVLWAEWLRPGVLQPGAGEILETLPPLRDASVASVFEPDALVSLLAALKGSALDLLSWWRNRLAPAFRDRVQFPVDIVAARGLAPLRTTPKVVVGTIHSVKGGQADVVYLFPDLSAAGDAQYNRGGASRDSVIRTFYVGITRTRETLYLCSPSGHRAVTL